MNREEKLALRARHLSPSLSLSYEEPLDIVRGEGAFLVASDGRRYLDLVNNVCHVGHCHPRVVEAGARQMAELNTNTRYLHEHVVRYAQRLAATFPDPLEVVFPVNSGSEANDLALRIARAATGATDVIVVAGAYHGHLSSTIELSPYKYDGAGGEGRRPHVHEVPMPDPYRGALHGPDAGERHAEAVARAAEEARAGGGLAAFFCESMFGCGGQVDPPPGYLTAAFEHVRAAGGLCVADEVQVGFGRVGSHFWAFERQGVVPDLVTLGKPIGNGHPLAAVVTTRALADAFHTGMEYFNTYGGNPVSSAIGLAVLDVIEDEGLQEHARVLGEELLAGLSELAGRHALIGDVRGAGLFLGVELVRDRTTLEPAAEEATEVVEELREAGILVSTDGPLHNVLKLKPPLVVSADDARRFLRELDAALGRVEDRRAARG
jgi:4-aminobutyrate aminotransferase-like enzyme